MLFVLKGLTGRRHWRNGMIDFAFWAINIGLAQTWASVEHDLWYARSFEFMSQPVLGTIRWLWVIGDTLFALGVVALSIFVVGLKTGHSLRDEEDQDQGKGPLRAHQRLFDRIIPRRAASPARRIEALWTSWDGALCRTAMNGIDAVVTPGAPCNDKLLD